LFEIFTYRLKGTYFTCDEDVQVAMGKWFREQSGDSTAGL